MLKNIIIILLSVSPAMLHAQDNGGKVEFSQTGKKFSLTGKNVFADETVCLLPDHSNSVPVFCN